MKERIKILVILFSLILMISSISGITTASEPEGEGVFGSGFTALDLEELNDILEEEGSPKFDNPLFSLNFSNSYDMGPDWYLGNTTISAIDREVANDKTGYLSFVYIGVNGGSQRELTEDITLQAGAGAGLGMLNIYLQHEDPEHTRELLGSPFDSTLLKYYLMLSPELKVAYNFNQKSSIQLGVNYFYGLSGDNWYHYYENKVKGPLSTLQGTGITVNYGYTF